MEIDERILDAVRQTEIIRLPKQTLSTFGITNIYYYLLTEPIYTELDSHTTETVIREGRVIAQRPRVVTPYYLTRLEGFSTDARHYFEMLLQEHGSNAPGIFYTYKNEPKEMNIVSDSVPAVVDKLNADIDRSGDSLVSIIKGRDELWDVSLMKFIYEVTRSSLGNNVRDFSTRGLLHTDRRGLPGEARMRIEQLFAKVEAGEIEPRDLKDELARWDVFEDYQDRFLDLFRKKS
ncbi:MAG: hypothetical protein JW967_09280 [Dehalococcoidales bacterium]|nr:hypothetical protein [Dehalococcoidales bacterium]